MDENVAIILAAVVGVFGALGGALIGPHFQRKHERWVAKRSDEQLVREKAQELFDELDRLTGKSHEAVIAYMKTATQETPDSLPMPDLGRIRAISTIYFPECQAAISEFEEEAAKRGKASMELIAELNKEGTLTADAIKVITIQTITDHQSSSGKLAKRLRQQLGTTIPRLKQ